MKQSTVSPVVLCSLLVSLLFLLGCGPVRGGDDDDSAADDDDSAVDDDDDSAVDDDDGADDDDATPDPADDDDDEPTDDDDAPDLTGTYSGQMAGTITLTDPAGGSQVQACEGPGSLDAEHNVVTGTLLCNTPVVPIDIEVFVDAHQVPGSTVVSSVLEYLVTLGIGSGPGDSTVINAEFSGSIEGPQGLVEIEASGVLLPTQ